MPWGYAADSGLMKDIVQINDYVESINQYTAGGFDGCVMTNMDALTIPAAGGVDSTALIVGDFSNGNESFRLHFLEVSDRLHLHEGQNVPRERVC